MYGLTIIDFFPSSMRYCSTDSLCECEFVCVRTENDDDDDDTK